MAEITMLDVGIDPALPPQARIIVAQYATDVADARILLDMLGLVEDPLRFPPGSVTARGVRDAGPQAAAVPLPAYGYGAVPPATPA